MNPTAVPPPTKRWTWVYILLCVALLGAIGFFATANITNDSVDYYSTLKNIVDPDEVSIVPNLSLENERSPGYPLLALPTYYLVSTFIEPRIVTLDIDMPFDGAATLDVSNEQQMQIGFPLRQHFVHDIFFKNFYIGDYRGKYDWVIIFALLFTSYLFLFVGLKTMLGTLKHIYQEVNAQVIVTLMVLTSPALLMAVIQTPIYATLTAVGLSAVFVYWYTRSYMEIPSTSAFFAGLGMGFLVLTRLECVILLAVVSIGLLCTPSRRKLPALLLGVAVPGIVLLGYNFWRFGNPFDVALFQGGISSIVANQNFVFSSLVDPASGIIVWSALTIIGILGLFFGNRYLKILGVASVVFIVIIYRAELSRIDINRYITVLIPFAVVGIATIVNNFKLYKKRRALRKLQQKPHEIV
ncbi:MAG: hypothetical protein RL094_752 [Candidatus Parcubacteria bacterium]|jgi:hypothetical protein